MSDLVIGIDGGGTHTRARLANTRGEVLGNGEAGPANPFARGMSVAQVEILAAVQRAFDDARIEKKRVATACLGIGGVDRLDERASLTAWANEMIAERVAVMNDGEIVLAAGTPDNWGIALVAGTGSIAWGKTQDRRIARVGGWGYLIGDEGSGFDLAREALRAATQAADGRGNPTQLLRAILDHWGLRDATELIPKVYQSGFKPADIAQLASVVVRVAAAGDPVAKQLVGRAGVALAELVVAVARRLDMVGMAVPLALTGGLLLDAESIRERLRSELQSRGWVWGSVKLVYEPVDGAVRMARELEMSGK